jgi:hypothetical protein
MGLPFIEAALYEAEPAPDGATIVIKVSSTAASNCRREYFQEKV